MIYLINFLLVPFYYFIIISVVRKKELAHNYFMIVVGIHAILFRTLANPFNYTDTEGYANAFLSISGMNFREAVFSDNHYTKWGRGYIAFSWLVSHYFHNPSALFVTLSIISVGGVMLYYKKVLKSPLIPIMLYLLYPMMYIQGFGVVRQHLAVVFLLWALYYIDNLKISIPLVIIGSLCHTSAIVFIPFFLFSKIALREFNSIKLVLLSMVGLVFLGSVVAYVLTFFSRYEEMYGSGEGKNNIVPVIVFGSMLAVYLMTNTIRRISNDRDLQIVRYLIYAFIVSLFSMNLAGAGRLTIFFLYAVPVGLSILYKYNKKAKRGLLNLYTICLFVLTIILVYYASDKYQEYLFFWEGIHY